MEIESDFSSSQSTKSTLGNREGYPYYSGTAIYPVIAIYTDYAYARLRIRQFDDCFKFVPERLVLKLGIKVTGFRHKGPLSSL